MPIQDHADVVIVGAGTAGCIAASLFSDDPDRTVLLIERGPDLGEFAQLPDSVRTGFPNTVNPPLLSPYVKQATAQGSAEHTVRWAWGELVGGGSAINGQVFLRPLVHDTEDWTALGLTSFSYESLLPSMVAIEHDLDFTADYHGASGPIPVKRFVSDSTPEELVKLAESARSLGHGEAADLNAPAATGVGATPFNADADLRISPAVAFLDPARGRPNLRVLPDTLVERIVIVDGVSRGVVVSGAGGRREISADLVILAAGTMATPQLLMLSGIGPQQQLEAVGVRCELDRPAVGANLQDHPMLRLQWTIPARDVDPTQPMSPLRVRFTSSEQGRRDDLLINVCAINSPDRYSEINRVELIALLMDPDSTGSVSLGSADPSAQPRIDLRYFSHDTDRIRMLEGIDKCLEIGENSQIFGLELVANGVDTTSRRERQQWLLATALATGLHATGSCRMGTDDSSVVDEQGRVRGVDRLAVIDASVLPTSPRVNTNATAMAVAHHLVSGLR